MRTWREIRNFASQKFRLTPELHCLAIFIQLWCNKRIWTQSLSIHCLECSIQRQVSYMPSYGRTKLRLVLYHCNQFRVVLRKVCHR